jgi:hypothetical protein
MCRGDVMFLLQYGYKETEAAGNIRFRVCLEDIINAQLLKKFAANFGSRRFSRNCY